MKELSKLWMLEINRNKAFRFILKKLHFSFCLITENERIYLKIEKDALQMMTAEETNTVKKLSGKKETFQSIFSGERKLRKAVVNKDLETTLSFREQLLLETLFYLARSY